jgi:uncharacterized membrane protein YtjA (UPF0391 family)
VTHRLATVLLLVALAAAAVGFGPTQPAAAAATSASSYLVVEVPGDVVVDDVAGKPGTSRTQGGWIPGLPSELAAALCKTFDMLFECRTCWEAECPGG